MNEVKFDDWFSSPSPTGSLRQSVVTYTETNDLLVDGIKAFIEHKTGERWKYFHGYPELTVHKCWSGYSEYTVTAQWDEIQVDWNGFTAYFEHLSEFFKALEAGVEWRKNY